MAEWLETSILGLWREHVPYVAELSMRQAMGSHSAATTSSSMSPSASPTTHLSGQPQGADTAHRDYAPPDVPPELRDAYDVLGKALGRPPSWEHASGKGSLAAQFADFVSRSVLSQSHVGGAAWATSHELWKQLLHVVGACAAGALRAAAAGCWEQGALLACCWNLHTGLLDAGMAAAQAHASRMEAEAEEARESARRCMYLCAGRGKPLGIGGVCEGGGVEGDIRGGRGRYERQQMRVAHP
jgi:hypothetical protein